MRCLVTGAYGFIGRRVVEALLAEGWDVTGAGRDVALGRRLLPQIDWIVCDFNKDLDADLWGKRLAGFDGVVNCVGILQSSALDDAARIHGEGAAALFAGAERAGVRRVIHVSAMSAEAHVKTGYAQSKRAGEEALAATGLNWLIVKPSLVIDKGSFGGTSLIRGLAGLPFVLPLPGDAKERFQPLAGAELAAGIARLLERETPSRVTLYAAGPQTVSVREIAKETRRWLGFADAKIICVPPVFLKPVLWLGDVAGWFGQPSALRSTAFDQMSVDEVADPGPFQEAAGLTLTAYSDLLRNEPATLQDRLHARTYFAAPLLRILLSFFWIATGVITLAPSGVAAAVMVLEDAGIAQGLARALVVAGAFCDMALGAGMLSRRFVRWAGAGQIALTLGYLVALTVLRPDLWGDPLGPLLKAVPLIAASLMVMALAEER